LISVFGSDMGNLEKKLVAECLDSQWIGFGNKVDEFEKNLCADRNFSNFVMVDSGSNALYLAITLLNLPQGSEVILPAFTWIACANAVVLAGLIPIFADVEISTMNISARTIKKVISHKTSCIMVVHFAGLPVEMDEIISLGFPVIEDAAHAIYSDYKSKPCGSIGDVGVFSFDSVKNLAVGEGGGLVLRNSEYEKKARDYRYCGIQKSGFQKATESNDNSSTMWWEYELVEPFIKMLPTNISASIGIAQLSRKDELQERRRVLWNFYQDALSGISDITIPELPHNYSYTHSFFTYIIRTNNRNELAKYLLKNGVYTTLRYHPLNFYSQFNAKNNDLTNTYILNDTSLSIPLHPRLSNLEIEKVVDCIEKFYK
jgi:dTDP-4-amino-4,6-dideoxygalactose transaminase